MDYLISKVRLALLQQILKAHVAVSFLYIYDQLGYKSYDNCYQYLFREHKCTKVINTPTNTNSTTNTNTTANTTAVLSTKRSYSEVAGNNISYEDLEINCKTSVIVITP